MRHLLTLLTALLTLATYAAEPIAIAFYDLGKLYDTSPSPFYDDTPYTPTGTKHWTEARYTTKLRNIVSVIDSLQMPIIALSGVENEEVVRDIVRLSSEDYSYVHRTIDYYDGLDFALLYYGDSLFVEQVYTTYHTLTVNAQTALGQPLTLHLTRRGDKLRSILPPDADTLTPLTIAWGKLSRKDLKRLGMDDALRPAELSGQGDSKGRIGWEFRNRIGLYTSTQSTKKSGVYISRRLLTSDRCAPLPTFSSDKYLGGYSNFLPTYLFISEP